MFSSSTPVGIYTSGYGASINYNRNSQHRRQVAGLLPGQNLCVKLDGTEHLVLGVGVRGPHWLAKYQGSGALSGGLGLPFLSLPAAGSPWQSCGEDSTLTVTLTGLSRAHPQNVPMKEVSRGLPALGQHLEKKISYVLVRQEP